MFQYLKAGQKILGMNARNFSYIRPANSRGAIRLANDKLRTKRLMRKAGIPVPKLFGVIKNRLDLDSFAWENLPSSFVLKPNMGLGGGGIMVIYGRKKNGHWIKSSGGEATIADFKAHIQDILDGRYS
ncbi:MAG: sugar-transfer associated ATP-grasp domain-containing protein, partial [bacterium]|nr:sugar-transfer associated ATP-grasp domain-containing protein [bacterium]